MRKSWGHAMAHEMVHEGDAVKLFVDVYQTGLAVARRPPQRKDFLTFHRSDDGNRVQDILTALSYASKHTHSAIRLTCSPKAVAWCLLAMALAPLPVTLDSELARFEDTDEYLQKNLFIPGLGRVGGMPAIRRLTEWRSQSTRDVVLAGGN